MDRRPTALTLLALWVLNFTTAVQFLIVAPILPRIAEALHVEEALLGTLVTAYALSFGVFALIAGPVSDHIGRRRVLLWGSGGMTLALLAHGLTTTFPTLLAARAFAGVCSGALSGASVAYIADAYPYDARGRANGWIGTALAAGQVLGIPLGALASGWGYQLPFVLFAGFGGLAFVLILRHLPDPDVALNPELSVASALRGYREALATGAARAAVVSYILMFGGIASFITFLPAWLEHRFDVGPVEIASLFMVGGLSNAVVGPYAGALSDRIGRKTLVVTGSVATAVIMALTPFFVVTFALAYVQFFLVMIFVALRIAPQQSLVSSLVVARHRGTLLSLCFATGQMLGFSVGSAVAGTLYTSSWGFAANGLLGGLGSLGMGLVVAFAIPEPAGDPEDAPIPEAA